MKICIDCKKQKSLTEFSKHSVFSDGLRSTCKQCYNWAQKSDPVTFFRKIYATQKACSTKRKHPPPNYTLGEFIAWADAQPNLLKLWDDYQKSKHDRNLAPSADRLNSNLPYTLANLELVTWAENSARGARDTKIGTKLTQHKAVRALNLDGTFHKQYVSLHEAARSSGSSPTTIQRIADKAVIAKPDGRTTVLKQSQGFMWEWAV